MSYLRCKNKKCHNTRKDNVVPMRRPKRAPSVCLDVPDCNDTGTTRFEWRDDAKDRKVSWLTRLLRALGL